MSSDTRPRAARRLVRLVTVVALLVSALSAHRLLLPDGAFACSCVAPDPGAPVFTGEEQAVFIGTARDPQADGTYTFAVERWFAGGTPTSREIRVASDRQPMPGGGMAVSTCGLQFEIGDRLIMSAGFADGIYNPGLCSPHAVVNSDEGAQLVKAAQATFGQGTSPGQVPDPRDTMPDDPGPGGFAIGMVGILILVVVIAVVVSMRRRREDDPAA